MHSGYYYGYPPHILAASEPIEFICYFHCREHGVSSPQLFYFGRLPLPTMSVFSNKKSNQYFGMNNITEFNNNPLSRNEFWRTTGPVSAAVILISVMIAWGSFVATKFRVSYRGRLRRKINDIEGQL